MKLTAEIAAAVDPDKSVYDSALDNFEKGFTSARVDEIFAELKAGVIPLIEELKKGTRPDDAWLQGDWDTGAQAALCDSVVKDLVRFWRAQCDVSALLWPFCIPQLVSANRFSWTKTGCSLRSLLCRVSMWSKAGWMCRCVSCCCHNKR